MLFDKPVLLPFGDEEDGDHFGMDDDVLFLMDLLDVEVDEIAKGLETRVDPGDLLPEALEDMMQDVDDNVSLEWSDGDEDDDEDDGDEDEDEYDEDLHNFFGNLR